MPDSESDLARWFAFFNEIGILHQLSRAVFEARLPDGVSVAHFSVLNHLIRVGDGATPKHLAYAFQVPKTTMSHTLAGLESLGYVRLAPNETDGRSKCVWLTEAGRTFRDDAIGLLADDIAGLAAEYETDRVAAVTPTLAEVRKLLDERR